MALIPMIQDKITQFKSKIRASRVGKTGYKEWLAILGIVLLVAAVLFGVWVGLWWAFVGGIVTIVEAFKADPVNSLGVAWGALKFFGSAFWGWGACILACIPGFLCLKASE